MNCRAQQGSYLMKLSSQQGSYINAPQVLADEEVCLNNVEKIFKGVGGPMGDVQADALMAFQALLPDCFCQLDNFILTLSDWSL